MSRLRSDPRKTPLWLRLSIVIGGLALLAGLVGAVVLVIRGDELGPDWGPGLRSHVMITGLEGDALAGLEVSVTWWEAESEAQVRQDAEPVLGSPGSFRLPPDAFDRTVELEILRNRVILHRQTATVRHGETVTVRIPEDVGPVPPRR